MTDELDSRLIRRAQEGDVEAFGVLVKHYQTRIFNLAFRMTGSQTDAADLAQETFVRAFQSMGSYRSQRPFYPWLYAVSLNLVRNHLKRRRLIRFIEGSPLLDQTPSDGDTPETALARRESGRAVQAGLMKLPFRLRAAVVLRYYQDLPFREIAEILGTSQGAVKQRVYRGLEKLREILDDSR